MDDLRVKPKSVAECREIMILCAEQVMALVRKYAYVDGVYDEDLHQDIYYKLLHSNINRWDSSYNVELQTFIVNGAKQHQLNYVQKLHRIQRDQTTYTDWSVVGNGVPRKREASSLEISIDAIDLWETIVDGEPDPKMKIILESRYRHSMNLEEISQIVGISCPAISMRLSRWVEKKKRHFKLSLA